MSELLFELVEHLETISDEDKYSEALTFLKSDEELVTVLVEQFFTENIQTIGYLLDAKAYFSRVEPDTVPNEAEFGSAVIQREEPVVPAVPKVKVVLKEGNVNDLPNEVVTLVQEKDSSKEEILAKPLKNPFKKYTK